MKIKTGLAVLFLFACCSGILSGAAAADDETGTAYYYGPAPYEQGIDTESGEQIYPDYMPPEFGRRPQPEQAAPVEPGAGETPVSADFVPYGEARERYSDPSAAPRPQDISQAPQQAPQAPADAAPEVEVQDEEGFVPYEYAREKYSN